MAMLSPLIQLYLTERVFGSTDPRNTLVEQTATVMRSDQSLKRSGRGWYPLHGSRK